jgi:rhodanese-related sulfurtransferase
MKMARDISPSTLAQELRTGSGPKLLDVRQPEEHAFASLPDSVLIPLNELMQRFQEIAAWKEEQIVVYCHHGIRSLHAIAFLEASGFQNLRNLSGGIDAWSTEVDPNVPRY